MLAGSEAGCIRENNVVLNEANRTERCRFAAVRNRADVYWVGLAARIVSPIFLPRSGGTAFPT